MRSLADRTLRAIVSAEPAPRILVGDKNDWVAGVGVGVGVVWAVGVGRRHLCCRSVMESTSDLEC